jgi:hypothetical protein
MSHSLLTTPKKKHAAVAIVTIGMAAVGYWFGSQRLSSKAPNPLIVPASALRLGKVLARGLYRHEIPLTNTSGETVTVARIESSCWCTQIEPASFSLGPGQSTTLVLSLDLMAAARLDSPQAEQELRVTLIPHIRERVPDQWPRWILAGQVQLPAVLNRSRVVFDGADRIVQGLPGPRCTARLITHAPVADLQVVSAAAASLVQAERQKLSESEWEIMFTARDGIPAGRFDELFYFADYFDEGRSGSAAAADPCLGGSRSRRAGASRTRRTWPAACRQRDQRAYQSLLGGRSPVQTQSHACEQSAVHRELRIVRPVTDRA